MPGNVPPASVLPPDHQLGMRVPKGGSDCAKCKYLQDPQTCGNEGFARWNGDPQLPAPADEYCCDLYESGESEQGEPQQGDTRGAEMMVRALQG